MAKSEGAPTGLMPRDELIEALGGLGYSNFEATQIAESTHPNDRVGALEAARLAAEEAARDEALMQSD